MIPLPPDDVERLARQGAAIVTTAFDDYRYRFRVITRSARARFEARDWPGVQAASRDRLSLYRDRLDWIVWRLNDALGPAVDDKDVWRGLKRWYWETAGRRPDAEIAETFFNSVTRRIFSTVGVDPSIEFVHSDLGDERRVHGEPVHRTWPWQGPEATLRAVLGDRAFSVPWADFDGDVALAAAALAAGLADAGVDPARCDGVDVILPEFLRNKGAYLVGRVRAGDRLVPLCLAVLNGDRGLVVDAVLTTSDEVSVVFSFTRSYFLLDVDNPGEVVDFLKTVMPRKPLGELYTSLGHFKHGKTVFYRELRRHLAASPERFLTAPGERGLVMIVFTLDGFDAVFKVIRDQPGYPKHTNRREVMERYRLVFRSDRVGRLVDAAEFEHVTFERSRFAPDLLEELERGAPGVVSVRGDEVEIHQLYIERRLTPLNLWVAGQPDDRVRDAVIDYGQAIRELAAADIFPGDLMIKNFGVTRHGRVVFYDYDELCATTECLFRRLPPARDLDDEMAPEPWFAVGPDDVFPEEFPRFLGLPERWRQVLLDTHPDLFTAEFWQSMQAQHRQGVLQDVFPYRAGRRLQRR